MLEAYLYAKEFQTDIISVNRPAIYMDCGALSFFTEITL